MKNHKFFFILIFLAVNLKGLSQDYRLELSLKAYGSLLTAENFDNFIAGIKLQSNYIFTKNVSAGVFYTQSDYWNDKVVFSYGEITDARGNTTIEIAPRMQCFGISFQVGTDQNKRFRFYGTLDAFHGELVGELSYAPSDQSSQEIIVGGSGFGAGLGFGLSLRFARVFSFNILEAKINYLDEGLNYSSDKPIFQTHIESGFVFRLIRKK